jgi:alkylated DNA repair dioxygenase AlkB
MQLPLDCKAWYYEDFISSGESKALWKAIEAIFDLSNTIIEMYDGRKLEFPHGRFNFADEWIVNSKLAEPWGQRKPWIEDVLPIKEKIEKITGRSFDACVGYYYKDGTVGFGYHYDIPCFDDSSILAALSIGHERVFSFRHIDNHSDSYDVQVSDGSLIVMGENCRKRYEHGLMVDSKVKGPRMVFVFMNFHGDTP